MGEFKRTIKIAEIGSWKGRSTHALCCGAKEIGAEVTAIDHFQGSVGEDARHAEAKQGDAVFKTFCENVKGFNNLNVVRADSAEAHREFDDRSFDMVFIDAEHTYEGVKRDIQNWGPKARYILCGHDYCKEWPDVMRAVDELLGEVEVHDSIWVKRLKQPAPNLETLKGHIHDGTPFTFVKRGDGEEACMAGEWGSNCDGHPYTKELGKKLRDAFAYLEPISYVVRFEDQEHYNLLLHRDDAPLAPVADFWKTVANSDKPKIFVGPERLAGAANLLHAKHVKVPLLNAFSEYDSVLEVLKESVQEDAIVVFCAGMPAKCWIAELRFENPSLTLIDAGSSFDPLFVGQTRTNQTSRMIIEELYGIGSTGSTGTAESKEERIPRRIFTIWLNENPEMPELIQRCITSQKIPGYEHRLITLDNVYRGSRYVNECLEAKNWVKASDWLRFYYVWQEGGIFLDADMEILPGKNFDALLTERAFMGKEFRGWLANSGFGSEAGHPLFKQYMDAVEANFHGGDEKTFEAGMSLLTPLIYNAGLTTNGIRLVDTDYFYPYDHYTGEVKITENTLVYHHYERSWMPLVSICIPTLGREEQLEKLLEEIPKTAEWPRYEVIVEQDDFENRQGAPKTLKRAVDRSTGEYVMFLGNDCIPRPGFLRIAMECMRKHFSDGVGLVGLNDGYWHGEFATHWLASKKLLPMLDGEFFHTGYAHCGCDNELTERCRMAGKYVWCEQAEVFHNHPIHRGFTVESMDRVYRLAYDTEATKRDLDLLKSRSEQLGFALHTGFEKPRVKPIPHPSYDLAAHLPPEHIVIDLNVLNVGIGSGKSGIASQLPFIPFRRLDHIEIHEPYIAEAERQIWDSKRTYFQHGDVRDLVLLGYDLVLLFDVLEHLPKEDALRVLDESDNALVFVPLEDAPRNNREGTDDIPSQDHLSTWTEEDFTSQGFKTERWKGFHREGTESWDALWAWKYPSTWR